MGVVPGTIAAAGQQQGGQPHCGATDTGECHGWEFRCSANENLLLWLQSVPSARRSSDNKSVGSPKRRVTVSMKGRLLDQSPQAVATNSSSDGYGGYFVFYVGISSSVGQTWAVQFDDGTYRSPATCFYIDEPTHPCTGDGC